VCGNILSFFLNFVLTSDKVLINQNDDGDYWWNNPKWNESDLRYIEKIVKLKESPEISIRSTSSSVVLTFRRQTVVEVVKHNSDHTWHEWRGSNKIGKKSFR
jgi:hypothetical protein